MKHKYYFLPSLIMITLRCLILFITTTRLIENTLSTPEIELLCVTLSILERDPNLVDQVYDRNTG